MNNSNDHTFRRVEPGGAGFHPAFFDHLWRCKNIPHDSRRTSTLASLLCLLILLTLTACQTRQIETSDGRPFTPEPVAAPEPPPGATANAIALLVGARPTDTNGNGYPDLIQVGAYLFARPHPKPVRQDGSFIFRLTTQPDENGESKLLNQWRIGGEQLRHSRADLLAGPGYVIDLKMLETGDDRYPPTTANLHAGFQPAGDSPPVEGTNVYTIQIGKTTASAGELWKFAEKSPAEQTSSRANRGSGIRTPTN